MERSLWGHLRKASGRHGLEEGVGTVLDDEEVMTPRILDELQLGLKANLRA